MRLSPSPDNKLILIRFAYSPRLVDLVRGLRSRKFDAKNKVWTIPMANSADSVAQLREAHFEVDPAITSALNDTQRRESEAIRLSGQPDAEFASALPLKSYQRVGAAFLAAVGSGILADEVGLGKTLQSLAVCDSAQAKRVLILCPAILKEQWKSEITRWLGPVPVAVIAGTADQRKIKWQAPARFYVANYELLLRDFEYIDTRTWDYIIADEGTAIKNPKAKCTKLIKKLHATHRLVLTGTPVANDLQDLWSLVDFCQPGMCGSYWDFLNRYCIRDFWGKIYSYQNVDELKSILAKVMIRRRAEEVLRELPECITTEVPFTLSAPEAKLYNQIRKELLFEIDKMDISKINQPTTLQSTIVKMLRLQQCADSMELLGDKAVSTKVEVCRGILNEALADGRKAIVFTKFSSMATLLARDLVEFNPLVITGDVEQSKRQPIVDEFNNNPVNQILIMTSCGQFGLNLQAASVVVHFDQEFSISKMIQRTGRAHRMGQTKTVLEYSLLAKGTVDIMTRKILNDKRQVAHDVLGDPGITMADLRGILEYEIRQND